MWESYCQEYLCSFEIDEMPVYILLEHKKGIDGKCTHCGATLL